MKFSIFVLQCLLVVSASYVSAETGKPVVVQTPTGPVEGFQVRTSEGHRYDAFLGIPYAEAPTGELRFERPVAKKAWTDTLKATSRPMCTQFGAILELGHGFAEREELTEDCLVVHVYTTNLEHKTDGSGSPKPELQPVMVWVHGGGFETGSGDDLAYGPRKFLQRDVVFVAINYRLGIMGFMSTGDDVVPGNMGLWDQKMGLEWVQKNIEAFGGDPTKVTLFGQSAGGMSVMHHIASPQSAGLFARAISQSGPPNILQGSVDKNPIYYVRKIAKRVGCDPTLDSKELVACMKKVDGVTFAQNTLRDLEHPLYDTDAHNMIKMQIATFWPVVDGDFATDPFLPMDPWVAIETEGAFNDVPLIIGNNKDEGYFLTTEYLVDPPYVKGLTDEYWHKLFPSLVLGREVDEIDAADIKAFDDLIDFYLGKGNQGVNENTIDAYAKMQGDLNFNAINVATARKLAKHSTSPVYNYLFAYCGVNNLLDFFGLPIWKIATNILVGFTGWRPFGYSGKLNSHTDEIYLMFETTTIPVMDLPELDAEMGETMLDMWTNFAKYGNPTPNAGVKWERLSDSSKKAMIFTKEGTAEFKERCPDFEKRYEYLTDVFFKTLPPHIHLKKSATWADPTMYPGSEKKENPKTEL